MKFVVSGKDYNKGLQNFLKVYYKEELKKGSLRNCVMVFVISIAVLISLCFVLSGMKEIFLRVIYLVLIVMFFILIGIIASLFVSKRHVFDVEKVEQIYEENVVIRFNKSDFKTEEKCFEYKDILKVVETKEYFYLFLNEAVAIPLFKDIYLNREEYISLINSKGIKVKEYAK